MVGIGAVGVAHTGNAGAVNYVQARASGAGAPSTSGANAAASAAEQDRVDQEMQIAPSVSVQVQQQPDTQLDDIDALLETMSLTSSAQT